MITTRITRGRDRIGILSAVLILAATACSDSQPTPPTVTTADSAGIQVVTNHATDVARWSLGAPRVSIGVVDGQAEYELSRVTSGLQLPDGRIVVGDGSAEIRIFNADGTFDRRIGRMGEGPGEFQHLTRVFGVADTLFVFDQRLERISRFSATDGALLGTISMAGAFSGAVPVGRLGTGDFILRADRFSLPESGVAMMYSGYVRMSAAGEIVDTLPDEPWTPMGVIGSGAEAIVGGPILAPFTTHAGTDRGYWIALGGDPELRFMTIDGRAARIARWPDIDRTATRESNAIHRQQLLERVPEEGRTQWGQVIDARGFGDEYPAIVALTPTRDGGVWAKRFVRPGETAIEEWEVINANGTRLAVIEMPVGIRVLEVLYGAVLAVLRDELDVEQVQLLPILTGGDA